MHDDMQSVIVPLTQMVNQFMPLLMFAAGFSIALGMIVHMSAAMAAAFRDTPKRKSKAKNDGTEADGDYTETLEADAGNVVYADVGDDGELIFYEAGEVRHERK